MALKIAERLGYSIFAGGCRLITDDGKTITKVCNDCYLEKASLCERGQQAQNLAAGIANHWVRTDCLPPPSGKTLLYWEHHLGMPVGKIRLGIYDPAKREYIEQASGFSLPENHVVTWMLVPEIPCSMHPDSVFARTRSTSPVYYDNLD